MQKNNEEMSAWYAGAKGYREGLQNPYTEDHPLYEEWADGWNAASDADKE